MLGFTYGCLTQAFCSFQNTRNLNDTSRKGEEVVKTWFSKAEPQKNLQNSD